MKSNLQNRRKLNKFSSTASIRYWALVLLMLLGNSGLAQASSLQLFFTPSSTSVTVGESFWVDFAITGLNPTEPSDIISAFDVDIVFEHTLLGITDIIFGTQLGLDTDQFSGFDFSTSTADIYQFSELSDADLKILQPENTVTLGRLSFIALAEGISALDFDTQYQFVSGALDSTPPPDGPLATLLTLETQSGSVTILPGQAVTVPEPSTLLLIFVGLSGLASQRRR